jgi:hypothetical protein
MSAAANSTETNRLLGDLPHGGTAWELLFARNREWLRRMVRLRLDRRVPPRFTSSGVLDEVSREASRADLLLQLQDGLIQMDPLDREVLALSLRGAEERRGGARARTAARRDEPALRTGGQCAEGHPPAYTGVFLVVVEAHHGVH